MHYVHELLDYSKVPKDGHVVMFTGNRVIHNGRLVMGGGNALACAKALPSIPRQLATKLIQNACTAFSYCLSTPHPLNSAAYIGVMFTKDHFKNPSNLQDVIQAIEELREAAISNSYTYHLPYPGCGLGGLTREDLDKHVEALPDNVYVYVV